ncbi:MAG: hypothetical protein ACE5MH_07815 [Terriglobia bacterium]
MRTTMRMVLAALCLASLAGCGGGGSAPLGGEVVNAQGPFTNASLLGSYGYSFGGFESGGNFVAAVGHLVLDGNGNITNGSQRRTEQGGFEFQFTITGNYTVNPDGTGTLTMIFDGSVDTWSLVLVAGGQKVKLVSIEPNNFLFGAIAGEMELQ